MMTVNFMALVRDYKSNVPLHMLEKKYKIPIHEIIKRLYDLAIKQKGDKEDERLEELGD